MRRAPALLLLALLVVLGVGAGTSHRLLVERSASMEPVLSTGDLLLVRMLPVARLRVGDVVTAPDPAQDRLLTHRVVAMSGQAGVRAVTTKGDAGTSVETWHAPADQPVGHYRGRLPLAGYVAASLGTPTGAAGLLVLAAAVLVVPPGDRSKRTDRRRRRRSRG